MGSSINESLNVSIKAEMNSDKVIGDEIEDLEWSADQETLLLYSLHGCKPVGPSKHFRMLIIQERLSSAMNKKISSKAIWKKLNSLYDLEALDEAEAEADAAVAVDTEFFLPADEFGELMAEKLKQPKIKIEEVEAENSENQGEETSVDIKLEIEGGENNEADADVDTPRAETKKEALKRGPKKRDVAVVKDTISVQKDSARETPKKDTPSKKDIGKDTKKGIGKDNEKKGNQEVKKEVVKEQKDLNKSGKRESTDKKSAEQTKKEVDMKKTEVKKVTEPTKSQREAAKPRAETPKLRMEAKRAEAKNTKTETPKPRVETLKKDSIAERKKETPDKKGEWKSPEKTPDTVRTSKLRARDKKETEIPETPTGTKRERSRDSISKSNEAPVEESPSKKSKMPATKGRPTRNSLEQVTTSPLKRRTRIL